MHELPLLIFTLFLQGSVGVTLWLAFGSTQRSALLPAAGAFVLASLGLLTSALHMGYPLNALNALRHVSSSWLSREIIFASLYLAALGFATLLMFVKKPGWKPLLVVAGLVGLVDVFCMAQIYMHASVVTWQHVNTWCCFSVRWELSAQPAWPLGRVPRLPCVRRLSLSRCWCLCVW
jgi:DMSO reductase anchor subunit